MIGSTRYRLSAETARQQSLSSEIARAQIDISTQTRLQRASDDPAASARVADIRRTQANEKTWAANVEVSSALANGVDDALKSVGTALDRVNELVIQARSGSRSPTDRTAIATELRSIAGEIGDTMKMTDSRGQPFFSDGDALAVPVGHGLYIAPAASKAQVFGGVSTPSGPQDILSIINQAATAIEAGDETATNNSQTAVTNAITQITGARADQGVRAARFDSARERLAGNAVNLADERGQLEDTDLPSTVAKLQAKLLTLDAAQSVFARISQTGLFSKLG